MSSWNQPRRSGGVGVHASDGVPFVYRSVEDGVGPEVVCPSHRVPRRSWDGGGQDAGSASGLRAGGTAELLVRAPRERLVVAGLEWVGVDVVGVEIVGVATAGPNGP